MARPSGEEKEVSPRDMAARAAWLSFVGGLTQDQIAKELGISRQRAQRLVARAMAEGMVRVRIDHPIADCLELERLLKRRFDLDIVRIAPSVPSSDAINAIAAFAAPELERIFANPETQVIALGTGRTLRAVVEQMQPVEGQHHKLVSLIGNVAPDGSASFYEVIMRLAEKSSAAHYPMSVPVMARSPAELSQYLDLPHVQSARTLALSSDIAVVGIGQMSDTAPLFVDGFISADDLADLQAKGAAGEISGHVFDAQGRFMDHPVNDLMVGIQVPSHAASHDSPVMCIAGGANKIPALRAALKGRLITKLITDEITAQALLT